MTIFTTQQGGESKPKPSMPFSDGDKSLKPLTFTDPKVSMDYVSMLIFGDYASGKTRLAASILDVESVEGVFYIDVDKGLFTARQYIKRNKEKLHDKHISSPEHTISEMTNNIRWLHILTDREKVVKYNEGKDAKDRVPYIDTVVIDTISRLGDHTIKALGEGAKAVATGIVPGNNQMASTADWGFNQAYITGWLNEIKGLPCHLIVTCHTDLVRNEKLGVWMPVPLLPPKLARALPQYFSQIHWLALEQGTPDPKHPGIKVEPKYVLLCKPEGEATEGYRKAKDSSESLPAKIENATMKELFGYFFGQQ